MENNGFNAFLETTARLEKESVAKSAIANDEEVVREVERIRGMQQERGDVLARIYLADEIVKLRRALNSRKEE